MTPFDYPAAAQHRKHGPTGYSEAERFRPWLRDEFQFRCVYCLLREQWVVRAGGFAVEHFLPVSRSPSSALEYDNLLYACTACNLAKAAKLVPDPTATLVASAIHVDAEGQLTAQSEEAFEVVRALGLDDPRYVRFRKRWLRIIELAQLHDPRLAVDLLGYPEDLPDLARLRPPGGNSRSQGIEQSCHALRERGELAEVY
jgi:hypothetical protein